MDRIAARARSNVPGRSEIQSFCFVHAADLHLDTPFEGIRGVAPYVGSALRDASLEAWDALVALCIERGAAFLVIAGDVYDGADRGLRAQLRFRRGLERLSVAGIKVFVVHGNHDPVEEGWSAIREWPPGCRVFGADAVRGFPVERGGERIATIYGISYAQRDTTENLSLRFPRRGPSEGRGEVPVEVQVEGQTGLRVGLLHCNVGGASEHAAYSACSLSDLAAAAVDYWALGHLHRHQVLARPWASDGASDGASDVPLSARGPDPWVVYSGNLQGRSTRATEQGAKGAVVVEVEAGRVANVELCALDRVRFLELEIDVSSCADLGALERELRLEAEQLRGRQPGRSLVLSARLLGRSSLQQDLSRADRLEELLASLRDAFRDGSGDTFTWWARLSSEVRRPIDRAALRESGVYAAELTALGDELADRPEQLQAFASELFSELPAELRGVELPRLESAELIALLEAAEETAFDCVDVDGTTERAGVTS